MTKLKKQKLLIKDFLKQMYNEDAYGNFLDNTGEVRYKCKKTSIRKEHKSCGKWFKVWSAYYKDIEVNIGSMHLVIKKIYLR